MTDTPDEIITLQVPQDAAGQRLDRLLAAQLPDISRSRLQQLIAEGAVTVNGAPAARASRKVAAGEEIRIHLPAPKPMMLQPEDISLNIVYEDAHLIVLDKPAGLVVHPAAGHETGTLVHGLLHHVQSRGEMLSGIGGVQRPGIVHRLDKDTSGLLVVAKTEQAHKGLARQFAAHGRDGALHRAYLALVFGAPRLARGTVDAPIGRHPKDRTRMAVRPRDEAARDAITHHEVLRRFPEGAEKPLAALLRCRLETGRTHQIRVHMAHIGHPVMGDPLYARAHAASARKLPEAAREALQRLNRQALHAAELGFVHPVSGERLQFESAPPPDMQALIDALADEEKMPD